jgi:hypothetical protein
MARQLDNSDTDRIRSGAYDLRDHAPYKHWC